MYNINKVRCVHYVLYTCDALIILNTQEALIIQDTQYMDRMDVS